MPFLPLASLLKKKAGSVLSPPRPRYSLVPAGSRVSREMQTTHDTSR